MGTLPSQSGAAAMAALDSVAVELGRMPRTVDDIETGDWFATVVVRNDCAYILVARRGWHTKSGAYATTDAIEYKMDGLSGPQPIFIEHGAQHYVEADATCYVFENMGDAYYAGAAASEGMLISELLVFAKRRLAETEQELRDMGVDPDEV